MVTTNTTTTATRAIHLILGGARSGKSQYGEQCAQAYEQSSKKPVVYLATAQAHDLEMEERIKHHQHQRPSHWLTIEEPFKLAQAITQAQQEFPGSLVLVDCLTLWVSNCLLQAEATWQAEKQALLASLSTLQSPLIMVSNEVGWGIVPMGELSRKFVDESGRLHQQLASLASKVSLVVAGIPMTVK